MSTSRPQNGRRPILAALACSGMIIGLLVGLTQRPAAAAVTAIKGEACAYLVNVGLFGGPQTLNGCGEAGRVPAASPAPGNTDPSYSPHVRITNTGSMSATDSNGASAVYGPAVIHGGMWPCEEPGEDDDGDGISGNCPSSAPSSGPQSAATSGSVASGTVSADVEISLHPTAIPVDCYDDYGPICVNRGGFGPFPVQGESLHAECSATETGVTGSATFTNAKLALSTDGEGNPVVQEDVPENPPPNYTRHGVITNVGDVFSVVYNQQIVNADGSLTVNAVHMYLFGPVAVGEVIRGSVTCGTTPAGISPTDTVAPTCGTPVVKPMGPEDPTPQVPRSELVGTFDAGNGGTTTGIDEVTNVYAANGTVAVGDESSSFNYLKFTDGQTGPLPVNATRTEAAETAGLPLAWSYDVTDKAGNTSHCRGVNDLVATDDTYGSPLGVPLTVAAPGVLANDADAEGNTLTATSASDPPHGTVALNTNGSFTYTRDVAYIGPDSFTYVLSDGAGGTIPATVTINVTGPTTLSVDDVLVNEGNAGTTQAIFTVLRGGDATGTTTVTHKTANATAIAGTDYTAITSSPLTFTPGETSKQVVVNVTGDTTPEKDETFTLLLSGPPKGTTLADAAAKATIRNDDGFSFLSVASKVVLEGNAGTTATDFTVTRYGNTTSTSTVTAKVFGGNATAGVDYGTVADQTLTFTPGQLTKTVTINVIGDVGPEPNETFNLVLSAASAGTTLADPSGTTYIDDDDGATAAPSATFVGLNNILLNEGNGGTPQATFTATRYGDTTAATTVSFKTSGGSATAGSDFIAQATGSVTFGPGELSKPVAVQLLPDTVPEKDETLNVALFGPPTGTILADAAGTATLLNDDGTTRMAVGNLQVSEGSSGTSVINVPITRTGNTTAAATVKAKTSGGNATAGTDYVSVTVHVVSFAAGATSATVPVTVNGDPGVEVNETFNVSLYAPGAGVVLADPAGTVTIVNDDA